MSTEITAADQVRILLEEIDRRKQQNVELHRALDGAGFFLEDGGLWEDRAQEAEAEVERLGKALRGAMCALRSYQYGNSEAELAKDIADFCEAVLDGSSACTKAAGKEGGQS